MCQRGLPTPTSAATAGRSGSARRKSTGSIFLPLEAAAVPESPKKPPELTAGVAPYA
ncbi:MAG: hypothetical protein R3F11_04250 [Verrucomicrobiales bacterium]